jgi:hypothetical protein
MGVEIGSYIDPASYTRKHGADVRVRLQDQPRRRPLNHAREARGQSAMSRPLTARTDRSSVLKPERAVPA